MLPPVIDTHCHLTHQRFAGDLEAVLERVRAAGVARVITIGTSVADARLCQELAQRHPRLISCAAGLDPFAVHAAGADFAGELAALAALLRGGAFCALGEIGLEYHHKLSDHAVQIAAFEQQLDLAVELDLPIVIHSRDAHPDMRAVLARHPRNRGVIHSFTGTVADARGFLDLGWHLSFNGMVTFKANDELRAAAAMVPADRLLVETDSPYLAPMPRRGQRCEPSWVLDTLQLIAEVRGERAEDVAAWTTRNAGLLFRLPAA